MNCAECNKTFKNGEYCVEVVDGTFDKRMDYSQADTSNLYHAKCFTKLFGSGKK
jgi:hypothetical protein